MRVSRALASVSPSRGDPVMRLAPYCRYQAIVLATPRAASEKVPRRNAPSALAWVNASVIVSNRPKSTATVSPLSDVPTGDAGGIVPPHVFGNPAIGLLDEELQLAVIELTLVVGRLPCRLHGLHIDQARRLL